MAKENVMYEHTTIGGNGAKMTKFSGNPESERKLYFPIQTSNKAKPAARIFMTIDSTKN